MWESLSKLEVFALSYSNLQWKLLIATEESVRPKAVSVIQLSVLNRGERYLSSAGTCECFCLREVSVWWDVRPKRHYCNNLSSRDCENVDSIEKFGGVKNDFNILILSHMTSGLTVGMNCLIQIKNLFKFS